MHRPVPSRQVLASPVPCLLQNQIRTYTACELRGRKGDNASTRATEDPREHGRLKPVALNARFIEFHCLGNREYRVSSS